MECPKCKCTMAHYESAQTLESFNMKEVEEDELYGTATDCRVTYEEYKIVCDKCGYVLDELYT
jgi:protein-arginine kinase activator protein McsA